MIHVFTLDGSVTKIHVDFIDEGVELTGDTSVIGDEKKALAYLPFFETDLRRNYSHLFPQPEPEPVDPLGGAE